MFPVEIFQTTLAKLTTILRRHEIRFHLTGGLTGTAYGEPRMTENMDVVVDPAQTQRMLDDFIESVGRSDFMFDEPSIRSAVERGGMFQLLDEIESLKLDIYPRELIPGELDRSVSLEIFAGEFLPVVSRVDAAASKLVWISKGSHKSRRDLRSIVRNATGPQKIEIQATADRLGLAKLLTEVLGESDEID